MRDTFHMDAVKTGGRNGRFSSAQMVHVLYAGFLLLLVSICFFKGFMLAHQFFCSIMFTVKILG